MTRPPNEDMQRHDVISDCELDAPPAKVWRMLTEAAFLSAWLLPVSEISECGKELVLDGREAGLSERIRCRLVSSVRNRTLRYRWVEEPANPAAVHRPDLVTDVTFWLTETGNGGTRLRIVHRAQPQMTVRNHAVMMMSAANANTPLKVRHAA